MERGTVRVSIQEGISLSDGNCGSLLRQGFKRQIYIGAHGPAHMTVSPMVKILWIKRELRFCVWI